MGEWRKCELGDVIELKRGYDLPSRLRTGGEFPLISSSGRSDTHDQSKVSGPGVVTGRYGTIGQVFYIEEDFWPLNTTLYVRDFKGNNPRFIYYFLQGLNWESFNDKSGVPGVNRNDVHRAIVSIADQDTQKAIVGVLSSIDDKIELNRRTNETLEAMAQAIFRDWFVDFGPVHRKMQGETDPTAILGGLIERSAKAAALAALFPDTLDDNELPQAWKFVPLDS
ncbi:MAG TPA: restriction endonuclease subunit S, partial [Hyphomonas sp.]|nr:restriction endonuclease subunit S [Hyphomonas sp.]